MRFASVYLFFMDLHNEKLSSCITAVNFQLSEFSEVLIANAKQCGCNSKTTVTRKTTQELLSPRTASYIMEPPSDCGRFLIRNGAWL
jgi:hypothetical protein